MPKYRVTMWRTYGQTVIVDAKDEDEASELGFEKWDTDDAELLNEMDDSQIQPE